MATDKHQSIQDNISLTSEELLAALRKAVSPPGKRGTWLQKLSNRQLAEVYHRLKMGQSSYKVVQIAQRDWKVEVDSSVKSLCRAVRAFKLKVMGDLQLINGRGTQQGREISAKLQEKADRLIEKLDAMGRMRWLIEVQTDRIELYREKETTTRLPFKATDQSIKVLGELLTQFVCMQRDLGAIPQVPMEISLTTKGKFDEVMRGLGPDGMRVADAVGRFLGWSETHAVKMLMDEKTGVYVPVGDKDAGS
jgi:hypothetical protein